MTTLNDGTGAGAEVGADADRAAVVGRAIADVDAERAKGVSADRSAASDASIDAGDVPAGSRSVADAGVGFVGTAARTGAVIGLATSGGTLAAAATDTAAGLVGAIGFNGATGDASE